MNKECYSINTNCSNFIKIKHEFSSSECTLLVDSGAELSILKINNIDLGNSLINSYGKCTITGINNLPVETLGSTSTKISLPSNVAVDHTFQLVDSSFPIPTDGILGRDFLTKFRCVINYDTWLLSGVFNSTEIHIPIEDNLNGEFVLPPRCEVLKQIHLDELSEDQVLISNEISPGVFCANTLINKNNKLAKFINTTENFVKIGKHFSKTVIPLKNYDCYSFDTVTVDERTTKLLSELKTEHIPPDYKQKLTDLCLKYNDVFALKGDILTCNNFYKQSINLNDRNPVYIKNYRTPEVHRNEICSQVENMLNNEIIRPSVSPYNSPLLLVPKKSCTEDKKWRLVVDFRQLNKKVVADKFPLPRIDDILDQLGRAKYFSTLDLMSGFHQIEIEEDSKKYTAFSTANGHYEFNRLPFGLNISPNSFQRMMTIALSGLPPECAFLYIDDIIVIGCSVKHHLQNLENVFKKLQHFNLKLNLDKCNFFCADVTFLGHHVSRHGILPDKSKHETIINYPTPNNVDDVRRFVAFCNYYRRFIPYFSEIAAPLNALLKKNAKFIWSDECKNAFSTLKDKLISPQILKFANFNKKFILCTDASKVACGAVLSQPYGNIDLPISYASRTLTKGEQNKSTIEQELTAIHWAITYFRPYLYGRRFTVRTDHRPLVYLFSMKDPSSKLTRMRIDLEEFQFDIEYVKGKENVGPDALSRIVIDSERLLNILALPVQTRSMTKPQTAIETKKSTAVETDHLKAFDSTNNIDAFNMPKLMFETQNNDLYIKIMTKNVKKVLAQAHFPYALKRFDFKEYIRTIIEMATNLNIKQLAIANDNIIFSLVEKQLFKAICNEVLEYVDIIFYNPAQIITCENKINKIISENHDTLLGGHVGTSRLLRKLRRSYYWTNMKGTINNFVKRCTKCIQNKHKLNTKEAFVETTTPVRPFDVVSIDTIGPFTKSTSGNRYALTAQCELTKFIIVAPIIDKQAKTLAKAFVENCILVHGCPIEIKSDMGTEYKNEIFQNICNFLDVEQKFSTAYHPETIGSLERNHRCLNEFLRHFINEQKDDWDTWLPYYVFSYNTTPHSTLQYSPFELLFGRHVNIPQSIQKSLNLDPIYNYDSYYTELKFKIQSTIAKARKLLEKSKVDRVHKQITEINPIHISKGETVWLKNENRRKLDKVYLGPFEVIAIDDPNVIIRNKIHNETQKVHKNRVIK